MKRSIIAVTLGLASSAMAQQIQIRFTNNQPTGGHSTSPLWVAMHNGSFDFFNSGVAASAALESMAELGDGAALTAALGANGTAGLVTTPAPTPQFIPGETNTTTMTVANPGTNRFFSFAAMFLPSNDFFVGNDNATQYPIFNTNGTFAGPVTIQIVGTSVWEAQTEVNNIALGIAFIVGQTATLGTPQTGTVQNMFSVAANTPYLQSLVGQVTPAYTLTNPFTSTELLATIEITQVPAPSAAAVALLGLGVVAPRRRR